MNLLENRLIERIEQHGPLPFAVFMSLALYDPHDGYYASGRRRTGWGGHFVTSPEIDAGFGALWARAFERVWVACGRPDRFEIAEIGPGEGAFASAVLRAIEGDFASVFVYRLVERVPDVHARQLDKLAGTARVEHSASVADIPPIAAGCVFANEILDNLPVHLLEATPDGLAEVMVAAGDDGLEFVLQPPTNPELARFVDRTGTTPAVGGRVEITLAAESLIAHVGRRLEKGAVFFVDYGSEGAALAARGGSLLSYSERGVSEEVLDRPGEQDITAHANWTSVTQALGRAGFDVDPPMTQREVLLQLGARDLDAGLKDSHHDALARGDGKTAVGMLSRRQALRALLDTGGLGRLEVVAGYKGVAPIALQREEAGP